MHVLSEHIDALSYLNEDCTMLFRLIEETSISLHDLLKNFHLIYDAWSCLITLLFSPLNQDHMILDFCSTIS